MAGNRCTEVERTRLLNRILPDFVPGTVLVLTAGPGTGKTLLIRQLLRCCGERTACLDLTRSSADIMVFVRQLEALFARLWPEIFPASGPAARGGDRAAVHPLPGERLESLLDELLVSGDSAAFIALDGCEVLAQRPRWGELVSLLLRRLPSFVAIVLASRSPLTLPPLPALRLEGRMLELAGPELHFDLGETRRLLSADLGPVGMECADQVRRKVGGWPAGVALLCLEMRKKGRAVFDDASAACLHEYIQCEVLAGLSPDIRRILCTASLLQPFDIPLLERFLADGARRLAGVFSSFAFFLEPQGDGEEEGQMRFAHLYADFFHNQATTVLGSSGVKNLHQGAAAYFRAIGRNDRALGHLVALEQWPAAVELILACHRQWFANEEYELLLSWTDRLPGVFVAQQPRLAVLMGQAQLYLGDLDRARQALVLAHEHARPGSKDWMEAGCRLCEVLMLRGRLQEGVDLAERLVRRSRLISRHRAEAMMFRAIGLHLLCRFDECERLWRQIATIARSRLLPLGRTTRCYLVTPKAVFHNLERGEFEESDRILDDAITTFRMQDPRKRLGWVLLFKGVLQLELHRYTEAMAWFREAEEVSGRTNRSVHAVCIAFLAFVLSVLGREEEARGWLDRAEPLAPRDLTLWAPIICLLARVQLSRDPRTVMTGLREAWNLANQRSMLLPMALTAYTAFGLRGRMPRGGPAITFCTRAADVCRRWQVAHREAQILLYLHLLQGERGSGQDPAGFERAMTLISERGLGFLLTDDPRLDGMELALQAVGKGIATPYFLDLCRTWGRKGCEAMVPLFSRSGLALREAIAGLWARSGYKPALPHIEEAMRSVKRKKAVARFEKMAHLLREYPPEPLHIRLFGAFALARGEEAVPPEAWKRQKARELFAMLCLHPDSLFTAEQLMETFWPDSSPDKARANLWSAVSAIRAAIEPELPARAKSSYLECTGRTYRLRLPAGSTIDTVLFEEEAARGFSYQRAGDRTRALLCFEAALARCRGELLPEDLYAPWSDEPRERLGMLHTRVLRALAEICFERRDLDQCIHLYRKIMALDPWDEDSCLALMRCHVFLGQELKAVEVYRRYEEVLREELGVAPGRPLQEFVQRIIRRRPAPGAARPEEVIPSEGPSVPGSPGRPG